MNNGIGQLAKRYGNRIDHLFRAKNIKGAMATASRGARHLSLGVRLANPLDLDSALGLGENLALATGTKAVLAQRLEDSPGLLTFMFELPERYWKSYTRADLDPGLTLGVAENNKQVSFDFSEPHFLIAGSSGSGKSECIKSMLTALCTRYTPDEFSTVIVDPHRDYTDFGNIAHLAAPIANDQGQIRDTLTWAVTELALKAVGSARIVLAALTPDFP